MTGSLRLHFELLGTGAQRRQPELLARLTRGAYGSDEVYTAFALESLAHWRALSDRARLPLFHRTGVLFFFGSREPYLEQTMAVHRRLGLPTELLGNRAMRVSAAMSKAHHMIAPTSPPKKTPRVCVVL